MDEYISLSAGVVAEFGVNADDAAPVAGALKLISIAEKIFQIFPCQKQQLCDLQVFEFLSVGFPLLKKCKF